MGEHFIFKAYTLVSKNSNNQRPYLPLAQQNLAQKENYC
jgi:hypothetical protein